MRNSVSLEQLHRIFNCVASARHYPDRMWLVALAASCMGCVLRDDIVHVKLRDPTQVAVQARDAVVLPPFHLRTASDEHTPIAIPSGDVRASR